MYQCVICCKSHDSFKVSIQHIIEAHPDNELCHKVIDGLTLKTVNYKVSAELCREQGRTITIDDTNKKIHISKRNQVSKDSPFKKIIRTENLENRNFCASDVTSQARETEMNLSGEDGVLSDLVKILPEVISSLKESGKLDDFIVFNNLVAQKRFPLDNIAFLLFIDVVRWFAVEHSSQFRYSEECRLFWSTGFKLFRGRFLRFMGGPKHSGDALREDGGTGHLRPETANINFIVPNKRHLTDEPEFVKCRSPGIMKQMIETISKSDPDQLLTYKMCVDGKKINASSKGEIDLWGHESPPTFEERKSRLHNESEKMKRCLIKIKKFLSYGYERFTDIRHEEHTNLIEESRDCITMLSHRIRDLREIKVGKETALKNLQKKCEGDWRNSRYAMVISSIRTSIYQLDNCIEDILNTNESLCKILAALGQTATCNAEEVPMQYQSNYVCLSDYMEKDCDTALIKQRTKEWFDVRDSSIVTGSTINKAIGLEGLKAQKIHLDIKAGRRQPEEVSPELQKRFDYGTNNELNAVSTICSSFMPAFHPQTQFFEEGCYVVFANNQTRLVVSPDGSLRGSNMRVVSGIEIKCPMPGKIFTTPVHYKLPKYYVPQVLSEMTCLGVDNLYFCSYNRRRCTVLYMMISYGD